MTGLGGEGEHELHVPFRQRAGALESEHETTDRPPFEQHGDGGQRVNLVGPDGLETGISRVPVGGGLQQHGPPRPDRLGDREVGLHGHDSKWFERALRIAEVPKDLERATVFGPKSHEPGHSAEGNHSLFDHDPGHLRGGQRGG